MNEQFSGKRVEVDFVVGSIYGTRSFVADSKGRLSGIVHNTPWLPGENVAFHSGETRGEGSRRVFTHKDPGAVIHDVGECGSCGFYAYADGADEYHTYNHRQSGSDQYRISAVIEGYGVTNIGTRGFRASKAKIRALVIPEPVPDPKKIKPVRWIQRRLDVNGDTGGAAMLFAALVISTLACFIAGPVIAFGGGMPVVGLPFLLLGLLSAGGAAMICYSVFTTKYPWREYRRLISGDDDRPIFDKIRENYPDVKTFPTYEAMIEEFKVMTDSTKDYSKDDEDFWRTPVI